MVPFDQVLPGAVSEPRVRRGLVDDIREEERREHRVEDGRLIHTEEVAEDLEERVKSWSDPQPVNRTDLASGIWDAMCSSGLEVSPVPS
jgi:hypothetical protein